MSCPVIAAAAGDSRKSTSAAISSGRISRPMGGSCGAGAAWACGIFGHRRLRGRRRDHVDGDASCHDLGGPAARQAVQGRLRGRVLAAPGLACATRLPSSTTRPWPALGHRRQQRVGQALGGSDVQFPHQLGRFGLQRAERAHAQHAGRVHKSRGAGQRRSRRLGGRAVGQVDRTASNAGARARRRDVEPRTCQPSASKACGDGRPMPELLPVTTATATHSARIFPR
jgi:hypothetical protein